MAISYLLNKSFYLHECCTPGHPCPAELQQGWPHGLFLVYSILFSQWDPEGHQGEGKHLRFPPLMAQPACPSIPVLQLHPFPWELPRTCLVGQPGDHPRMLWGTPWGPRSFADPISCPQASGTAPSVSSCGSASGARRSPCWAPSASLSSRATSTSWAGSPQGHSTTRSWSGERGLGGQGGQEWWQ